VHVHDTTSTDALDHHWLRQRLGFKLGKFARRIDRADITLNDESGPKGAPTIRATVEIQVARHEPVVATASGATARAAVSAALRSCERTFRRRLERARTRRDTIRA
jgi:hypothetical protein